jgi:hypothetical protein
MVDAMAWLNIAVLILGIASVALSLLGAGQPLGISGAVLAISALVYQHFTSGAVEIDVMPENWTIEAEAYVYRVSRRRHGKRAPSVTVWQPLDNGGHEEVMTDISTTPNGDVVVAMGMRSKPSTPFRLRIT